MPTPKQNESEKEFMKRCIPEVIKEGKGAEQAYAICKSLFEDKPKASTN